MCNLWHELGFGGQDNQDRNKYILCNGAALAKTRKTGFRNYGCGLEQKGECWGGKNREWKLTKRPVVWSFER